MDAPLADYDASPVSALRDALTAGGFDVPYGDPALIAQAIVALAEAAEMPLRVPLGSVAWDNINREARARLELLSTQKDAAYSCDQKAA